jgi:ribosomal protein S18 acetylase RimI-like enzyme
MSGELSKLVTAVVQSPAVAVPPDVVARPRPSGDLVESGPVTVLPSVADAPPRPRGKSAKGRRTRRATREPLPLPRGPRPATGDEPQIEVRRMHRRDLNRAWEFLKISFRDVNLATVEYQRPRTKSSFAEIYEDEAVDQLLFEVDGQVGAYAECAHEIAGSDWLNPRYFERRDMRPLFVEEIAVHPEWHGRGVGSFVLEQLHHLAKVRGLTHIVLEVAENNEHALGWYRKRGFRKLDAAIFMAHSVEAEPELLPPRAIEARAEPPEGAATSDGSKKRTKRKRTSPSTQR